ncbi:MAG: MerR family transcriptional regulator [Bacillota bacterium]
MKIGEFAKKYGVKKHTIRYYMKLNLLIPQKQGAQYNFDKSCEKDLEEILKLKKMDFSLKEIKEILNFIRLAKNTKYMKNKYYKDLYKDKLDEITEDIKYLENAKKLISKNLKEINEKMKSNNKKIGVDLSILSLIECPECKKNLKVFAKNVIDNQIIEGKLKCECGFDLSIKDGIIYMPGYKKEKIGLDDNFIEDYILQTEEEYIDEMYETLEWASKQTNTFEKDEKIILEIGTGSGVFLRHINEKISESSIYICTDIFPEYLEYTKKLLEEANSNITVLFIATNLPDLPLKNNIIDLVIDYAGTSNFCFEDKRFLPDYMQNYFKSEHEYLATFITYPRFGPNNIVKKEFRKNFISKNIKRKIEDIGYYVKSEHKSPKIKITEEMSPYETYAQPGDKVNSYQVYAKKISQKF